MSIIEKIDNKDIAIISNKELAKDIEVFIKAHKELEPTFVINFWFPIQMENHPEKDRWESEISVAAKTREDTEKVGPEGDGMARKLVEEVSRRMFDDKKYARFILLTEALDFLLKNKMPNKIEFDRRLIDNFVYGAQGIKFIALKEYAQSEGHTVKSLLGDSGLDTIKGMTAFPGFVSGTVKIILSKDKINEVQSGDVLVAAMTTPEYIPAMKKAAAFITDEGGVTCHAAIVAREMKKPCIIGTKIATKVLKDGDLVEVDADKGIVKILKRVR